MGAGKVTGVIAFATLVVAVVAVWMPIREGDRSDFNSERSACLDAIEKYSTNMFVLAEGTSAITAADFGQDLRFELVVERSCFVKDLIDPDSEFVKHWSSFDEPARVMYPLLRQDNSTFKKIEQLNVHLMLNNSDIARDWVQKQQPPGWLPWVNRPAAAPKFDTSGPPPGQIM